MIIKKSLLIEGKQFELIFFIDQFLKISLIKLFFFNYSSLNKYFECGLTLNLYSRIRILSITRIRAHMNFFDSLDAYKNEFTRVDGVLLDNYKFIFLFYFLFLSLILLFFTIEFIHLNYKHYIYFLICRTFKFLSSKLRTIFHKISTRFKKYPF